MAVSPAPACRGPRHRDAAARRALPTLGGAWILFGAAVAAQAAGAVSVPAIDLPSLEAPSFDAPRVDLRAAIGGRAAVVHFFATWCEACRAETAALARLAARMRGRPFTVVAVSVGEPAARVVSFFKREFPGGPPFLVLLDEGRAAVRAWGAVGLPASFALDARGLTRAAAAGAVDWDSPEAARVLEALLSDAAAPSPLGLPLALPLVPPLASASETRP